MMMTRSAKVFATAVLLLTVVAIGRGQGTPPPSGPPRAGTALVAGQVVDNGSKEPLTGVVVALTGRGMPPLRVVVDATGRFAFRDLPAGPFNLIATKPGYLGGQPGQQDPMAIGLPIELADGQHETGLTLRLWKLGALTGTAYGDAGVPLVEAEVHALRRTLTSGRWRLTEGPVTATDDHGHYRLSGLTPGEYVLALKPAQNRETALLLAILSANPTAAADVMTGATMSSRPGPDADARVRNYPVVFYPSVSSSDRASTVVVAADKEQAGLDFHVKSQHFVRVSGSVAGFGGGASGLSVRLVPTDADAEGWSVDAAVTACEEDGRFEFSAVPAGRFVATVVSNPTPVPPPNGPPPGAPGPPGLPQPLPAEPTWWARVPVTIGTTNITGLTLPLERGRTVNGRAVFDGLMPQPSVAELAQITIRLEPADQPPPAANAVWRGRVGPDGRFTTMGVPPGRYFLRVATLPRYWTLLSALSGSRDALDAPLEIRETDIADVVLSFANRPLATVSGTARDAEGQPSIDAAILIFPVDRALWADTSATSRRLRLVRPLQGGTYTVQGLPAGEYFAAAVSGVVPAAWQDPQKLAALTLRATRVRVDSGETRALDLQVIK
jgi:hypothetical protein